MPEQLLVEIELALLAREARHLLLNLERLGFLPDEREGASEQAQRVEVAWIGLEANLELRERLQAVFARAALDVELGRDARVARVHAEMQDALDDFEGVFAALEVDEKLGRPPEKLDGLVEALDAAAGFGEAQMGQRIA